jgi:hypothetical protein
MQMQLPFATERGSEHTVALEIAAAVVRTAAIKPARSPPKIAELLPGKFQRARRLQVIVAHDTSKRPRSAARFRCPRSTPASATIRRNVDPGGFAVLQDPSGSVRDPRSGPCRAEWIDQARGFGADGEESGPARCADERRLERGCIVRAYLTNHSCPVNQQAPSLSSTHLRQRFRGREYVGCGQGDPRWQRRSSGADYPRRPPCASFASPE